MQTAVGDVEVYDMHDARAWLVLALLFAVACSGVDNGEAGSRGPLALSEDDLAAAEVYFAPIAAEERQFQELRSRDDADAEAIQEFVEAAYSPSIEFHDESMGDDKAGHDDVTRMYETFLAYFGDADIEWASPLLGDTTALSVIEFWNMALGRHEFTESEPLVEVDLIEIEADRVGSVVLFYDLASLRRIRGERPQLDGSLQDEYVTAWATAAPTALRSLYAEGALRHDGLADDEFSGVDAIVAEAERWSTALPEATWTVRLAFGEPSGQQAGAVIDIDQQGCTVVVGVLLDLDEEGLISLERLHYDPETLRTCGWID